MSYHVLVKRPEQHLVYILRKAGVCVRTLGWYSPFGSDPIPIRQFILPNGTVYRTDVWDTPSEEVSGSEVWQSAHPAKPQRPR